MADIHCVTRWSKLDTAWMGVSVETQDYTWRDDKLRQIPAPTRFISAEPLLGPLTLNLNGIAWVITGAESGRGA